MKMFTNDLQVKKSDMLLNATLSEEILDLRFVLNTFFEISNFEMSKQPNDEIKAVLWEELNKFHLGRYPKKEFDELKILNNN